MKKSKKNTLDRILDAGEQEFLEKGFQAASFRNIVKNCRCDDRCILWVLQKQRRIV